MLTDVNILHHAFSSQIREASNSVIDKDDVTCYFMAADSPAIKEDSSGADFKIKTVTKRMAKIQVKDFPILLNHLIHIKLGDIPEITVVHKPLWDIDNIPDFVEVCDGKFLTKKA